MRSLQLAAVKVEPLSWSEFRRSLGSVEFAALRQEVTDAVPLAHVQRSLPDNVLATFVPPKRKFNLLHVRRLWKILGTLRGLPSKPSGGKRKRAVGRQ